MKIDNFFEDKQFFFDRWANFYDLTLTSIFYQTIHKRLLEFVDLSNDSFILDLGCGTGKLIDRLGMKYPNIKGIGGDLSPQMLYHARRANRHHPRFIFTLANAHNLPFAENQFNAVFNTISFLHYRDPQLVFKEIDRVLKPEGYFYLADYISKNKESFVNFSPGGIRFYTKKNREKFANNVGLKTLGHYYLFSGVVLSIFQKIKR